MKMMTMTQKESEAYDRWWNRGGKEICEISKERTKYRLAGYRLAKSKTK
jgi:hypothetical protein